MTYYIVSQKSRNPKHKGKYFVGLILKFQFVVSSDNTVTPTSRWFDAQFICIHWSLVNCLCNKHHAVFNNAACLLLNITEERSHMKQLNKHIGCTFLKLLYQICLQSMALLFAVSTNTPCLSDFKDTVRPIVQKCKLVKWMDQMDKETKFWHIVFYCNSIFHIMSPLSLHKCKTHLL
jgi:hypothetical protein